MKNYTVYKKTSDEWHPNFYNKLVQVSYSSFLDQEHYPWDAKFVVNVWGADDCGMEKWYSGDDGQAAWNTFIKLIGQQSITKDFCRQVGLKPA